MPRRSSRSDKSPRTCAIRLSDAARLSCCTLSRVRDQTSAHSSKEASMRRVIVVVFALFIGGWLWLDARAQQANGPLVRGAHKFEKVAEGIYYATASGTMNVGANSPVIVSDHEAIVIDSETSQAAGRALVQDI